MTRSIEPPAPDESGLIAVLLRDEPGWSRNRQYELLSSELGRRARRRAAFLRSIVRDIARVGREGGSVVIERGSFVRAHLRFVVQHPKFTRRAYLTEEEAGLLARTFPLAAQLFGLNTAK